MLKVKNTLRGVVHHSHVQSYCDVNEIAVIKRTGFLYRSELSCTAVKYNLNYFV